MALRQLHTLNSCQEGRLREATLTSACLVNYDVTSQLLKAANWFLCENRDARSAAKSRALVSTRFETVLGDISQTFCSSDGSSDQTKRKAVKTRRESSDMCPFTENKPQGNLFDQFRGNHGIKMSVKTSKSARQLKPISRLLLFMRAWLSPEFLFKIRKLSELKSRKHYVRRKL